MHCVVKHLMPVNVTAEAPFFSVTAVSNGIVRHEVTKKLP